MNNRNNNVTNSTNKGGVHLERGRGYRASLSRDGLRIRSQRFQTKTEATRMLSRIRAATKRDIKTMSNQGLVSISVTE